MSTYSVAEAKSKLSELLAAVEAGRPQVITKRGKPIAHVVPVENGGARIPFDVEGLRAFVKALPDAVDDSEQALARRKAHERF
jgi:prevent-host-death family protein